MIRLAIHGAAGRMGRRLVALASENPELRVTAAIDRSEPGTDAGVLAGIGSIGVVVEPDWSASAKPEVVIDFSTPAGTRALLPRCVERGVAVVIGTTGLSEADQRLIDEAAGRVAVLQAPNMSLGVNLLFALAGEVARRLGDDYDIEIVEAHHRMKKDAPSGTALGIARSICEATGKDMGRTLVHGREGEDVPRARGTIGMHAVRLGDVVGDHTVHFASSGERLELTHRATTRDVFVRGALRAAGWLAGKPSGRYAMRDVLGLG